MTTYATDASWSLGVLIGGPIAALCILIGLLCVVGGIIAERNSGDGLGFIVVGGLWTLSVIAFCASPLAFYPFDTEYHQWQPTGGTVSSVDKRLMGSGDGLEEKFVVRFEGDPQQYGCQDTRCASVDVGDQLDLTCKRAWQYTGIDGYDCRFVSTEEAS